MCNFFLIYIHSNMYVRCSAFILHIDQVFLLYVWHQILAGQNIYCIITAIYYFWFYCHPRIVFALMKKIQIERFLERRVQWAHTHLIPVEICSYLMCISLLCHKTTHSDLCKHKWHHVKNTLHVKNNMDNDSNEEMWKIKSCNFHDLTQ